MERSLVLIKPDAVQRGLAGAITSRLEQRGLKIVAMKMLHVDKALAERHYAIHQDKPFFKDLVAFITSSPIIAAVFEGARAVEIIRQTMGATDPLKAASGSIRGDLGLDLQQNLVHGSDSVENAVKEINIFFKPEEIMRYTRDIDKWIKS
jgi:nucleoside-diphosphate kinase